MLARLAGASARSAAAQLGRRLCSTARDLEKATLLEAVRKNGFALLNASAELRADREVVLEAVRTNCWALELASDELRADREVVLEAVRQNGKMLRYASNREIGFRCDSCCRHPLLAAPQKPLRKGGGEAMKLIHKSGLFNNVI